MSVPLLIVITIVEGDSGDHNGNIFTPERFQWAYFRDNA